MAGGKLCPSHASKPINDKTAALPIANVATIAADFPNLGAPTRMMKNDANGSNTDAPYRYGK